MKFALKTLAAAAALASSVGAYAVDGGWPESSNPNMSVVAFNLTTRAWFIGDVGVLMNSFLPNGTTLQSGDGTVDGTVTPTSGYNLTKTFSGWSSWFSAQTATASSVRWFFTGSDSENFNATNVTRLILSAKTDTCTSTGCTNNALISTAAGGNAYGGLGNYWAGGVQSADATSSADNLGTLSPAPVEWDTMFGWANGANNLALIGDSVGLYYNTLNGGYAGDGNLTALRQKYGNGQNFAKVSLDATGTFVYDLAPAVTAVPLPPSMWLMGAGLAAMGLMARRRRSQGLA